jgi:phage protein D
MPSTDPCFFLTVVPAGLGLGEVKLSGTLGADPQTKVTGGPLDLRARVTSLTYEDDEKESDKLSFSVDNYTLALLDSPLFRTGSIVRASWGYPGNMAPTRECVIQKIKGFSALTVTCFAKDCLMNKVQRARVFENLTRHAVVAKVAGEHGFGPGARFIDDDPSGEVVETLPQARMTDAQLLRALADVVGFSFYVDFDGLHWHARKTGQRPIKTYDYFVSKRRGEVLKFEIENDLFTRKAGGVTTKGAHPVTKEATVASGDNATSTQTAVAPVRELLTGVDGRDGRVLDTTEKAAGSQIVGPSSGATPTAAGAKAAAVGAYDKYQLTASKAILEAVGDPQVLAKSLIQLDNAAAGGGKWWAKKVTHKLGQGGYKMTYALGREGPSKKDGGVQPKAGANASKPVPPTDPSSIFHEPASDLALVSGVDGSVSFKDTGGRSQSTGAPDQQTADPTAWYRQ